MNDHSEHSHDEPSSEHGESSESTKHQGHHEPLTYCVPGTVLAQINHPAGENPKNLADLIDQTVQKEKLGFPEKTILGFENFRGSFIRKVQPGNILTFANPSDTGPIFSIVPIELNSNRQEPLIAILQHIYERLNLKEGPYKFPPQEEVVVEAEREIFWQAVSPNWLLGSGGHGKPHPPSPGSWPLARKARKKTDWNFSLVEKDSDQIREWPPEFANDGDNVHVAILDTAPCGSDLDEAHEAWHTQNDLIDRLLKPEPDRELQLITDFYAEIELLDYSLARHGYRMDSHGPFVAGEIASIAPKAKLHLYKVFTSYGSASTLTIAQGVLRVLADLRSGKLGTATLVNFSGGFAAPKPGTYNPDFHPDFPIEFQDPETLEHMQTSLRALFDELTNQDQVIVVAAAGNDSDPEKGRAPTRMPAAYENVIGVGAMPKVSKPKDGSFPTASYSNLADDPPSMGYVTLGGEPGRENGILGMYLSHTPYYLRKTGENHQGGQLPPDPNEPTRDRQRYNILTHNQEGSADWAGTSQSTPIITGSLARWCGQQIINGGPITVNAARQALTNLSQGATTAAGEQVIRVIQG
jgi:hypothetical protein